MPRTSIRVPISRYGPCQLSLGNQMPSLCGIALFQAHSCQPDSRSEAFGSYANVIPLYCSNTHGTTRFHSVATCLMVYISVSDPRYRALHAPSEPNGPSTLIETISHPNTHRDILGPLWYSFPCRHHTHWCIQPGMGRHEQAYQLVLLGSSICSNYLNQVVQLIGI